MKYPIVSHVETRHDGDGASLLDLVTAGPGDCRRGPGREPPNHDELLRLRQASQWMRQTLQEYRDSLDVGDDSVPRQAFLPVVGDCPCRSKGVIRHGKCEIGQDPASGSWPKHA